MKNAIYILALVVSASVFAAETQSKKELAKTVLSELGVATRFDTYITLGADQAAGGDIRNPKLHQWHQGLWIQELGWSTVEDAYIAHFEAKFSESELKELLVLSKNPTIKKLLNEELIAFRSTFTQRNKTFARFWHRYNSMEFSPPEEAQK
jgi:hypothetical protein